jgi:integrase
MSSTGKGKNSPNCGSQNGKAKSLKAQLVGQIAKLVRKSGLTYEDWRYVARHVRRICELRPTKKGRRLPKVLNSDEFRRFYQIVDRAEDVQHALMLRLLFYTAVRVSELCRIEVTDVDLDTCKIRVNLGKGKKDRYVLFGKTFATALRTHMAAHPHNRYLF